MPENFDQMLDAVIKRLDDRYVRQEDCERDMGTVKKEHGELVTLVAKISTTLDHNSWVIKTFLGAFIAAIVGGIWIALKMAGG